VWRAAIRCGLGGTALGLATLVAFAFVGVPTVQVPALLTAADLPPGFTPEPVPPSVGGCAALLADPPAGAVSRRYRQARTGATVWEAVAQPAGDVLDDLRSSLVTCGLPVEPRGNGFIVDLPDGYLTATHVGSTVMVLRCAGAGPAVLDTALGKLAPLRSDQR